MRITPRRLRWIFNLWPPFAFAGIRVRAIGPDWASAEVELRARPWTRNYVGTHFGGSLFAMTDPFWMILLMHRLGREYVVWDKSGAIDFVAAVREPVYARFALDDATVASIRAAADADGKALHWFETDIATGSGTAVARVRKQVYVRRKRRDAPDADAGTEATL